MNKNLIGLIRRYTIILIIIYGLDILFGYIFPKVIDKDLAEFIYSFPVYFGILLNIILALIISFDIKKDNKSYPWIIIMTILIRPLGVIFYILLNILDEKANTQHAI